MSVVTLDGRAFPSVINVRVDGRLRRYVPCGAGPVESGQESGHNRDTVQIESPAVQNAPECDREALLALAGGLEAYADRILKAAKSAQFGGGPRMGEAKHDADEWRSIARRIREACGEVVA